MTHYLLAVHTIEDEAPWDAAAMERAYRDVDAFNQEFQAAGAWVFAGGLEPPDRAAVVRSRDGDTLVTDGPFAESKEQIGGFWVIDVADRDTALDWAARATIACQRPVEVRPFQADT